MPIHPTAIIHPDAKIPADAEIGAGVCIEGAAELGARCVVQAHAILAGRVRLGDGCRVGYGAVIGAPAQHLSFGPDHAGEVVMGNDNVIRELCTIHRSITEGGATRMGDHNYLMAGSHLGHDVQVGSHVVIANNALLAGHVQIGDRVFIGGASIFHQHVRVGRLALTQGGSGFSKDVPPYTVGAMDNVVAGLNVVGLRRAGLDAARRLEIKSAFKLLYKSGLNTAQALAAAQEREWGADAREFFDFVRGAKRRGICDVAGTARGAGNAEGD